MTLQIANPLSTNDIIKQVELVRKSLRLNKQLYFPVVQFAEMILGETDSSYNFIVCEDNELPDKYACYNLKNNTMTVRNSVYELACEDDGRSRFTFAHEIGHYFLHREGVALARVSSGIEIKTYMDPEWQANTFASELLMPNKLIQGLAVDEIKCLCRTSGQAASIAFSKANKKSQAVT